MKKFLRNALIGVMLAATITTLFTGCGKDNATIPADSSAIVSQEESPGYAEFGDTNADATLYKVYWNDSDVVKESQEQKLIEAREGATVVEGSTMFNGLFKVYQDEEGEQFIISNATRVYLTEDGQVPAQDMTELRLEGTGDRVYIRDTDIEVEAAKNAVNDFLRFVDGEQAGYDDRAPLSSQSDEVKLLISQATAARVNNMPAAQTISLYNGYVEVYSLLDTMSEMGYVSDFKAGYVTDEETGKDMMQFTATVNAVGNRFQVQINVDIETGIVKNAKADGKDFSLDQAGLDDAKVSSEIPAQGLQISLQNVEDLFGWDIEVYADETVGEPFVNIVTDNRDIAKAENFVAYQVTQEEEIAATETSEDRPEDQVTITEEQLAEGQQKSKEIAIQRYMQQAGMTREEAEAQWQKDMEDIYAAREENEQKREAYNQQEAAKTQAHLDAIDQWYRENTGMSHDEWLGLTNQEKTDWMYAHPDIDFSTRPTY